MSILVDAKDLKVGDLITFGLFGVLSIKEIEILHVDGAVHVIGPLGIQKIYDADAKVSVLNR